MFCIVLNLEWQHLYFVDVGAWQYIEQHRHAYFDKMQVIIATLYFVVAMFDSLQYIYIYIYIFCFLLFVLIVDFLLIAQCKMMY